MSRFLIEFEGSVPEYGRTELDANDLEQAQEFGKEYVSDLFPEMSDVVFTRIVELND